MAARISRRSWKEKPQIVMTLENKLSSCLVLHHKTRPLLFLVIIIFVRVALLLPFVLIINFSKSTTRHVPRSRLSIRPHDLMSSSRIPEASATTAAIAEGFCRLRLILNEQMKRKLDNQSRQQIKKLRSQTFRAEADLPHKC